MSTVCCFGEILLRFSPAEDASWVQQASMPVYVGGAELNVATALSAWGIPVRYITALPQHFLGDDMLKEVSRRGIDASRIQRIGHRVGAYYLQQGADLKRSDVIYDRSHSAFSALEPGTIQWDEVLDGSDWLHLSAISPALSRQCAALTLEAATAASRRGMTVSMDLNYRSKLWKYGTDPVDIMRPILDKCQVVMGNLWAAEALLGIHAPLERSAGCTDDALIRAAETSMMSLARTFPSVQHIGYTFRLDDRYFGVICRDGQITVSETYKTDTIVDRVGSGDCFMGGLIYGIRQAGSVKETINFAAAAAVGKMGETGDCTRQTVLQIKSMMQATLDFRGVQDTAKNPVLK